VAVASATWPQAKQTENKSRVDFPARNEYVVGERRKATKFRAKRLSAPNRVGYDFLRV